MSHKPRLIIDNDTLRREYQALLPGERVATRLRLAPGEEYLLLDLEARGVELFPPGLAQALSRSKVMQAAILAPFMLPDTLAVHDLHTLHRAAHRYQQGGVGRVVVKLDRANAGMGVLLFGGVEEVINAATLQSLPFPFLLQPFVDGGRDLRVIFLGEYREAYLRYNPVGFRHNLHHGGGSEPRELTREQVEFSLRVMERGRFPYAHLDLFLLPDGDFYLGEINLRGGLRGAAISPQEYSQRLAEIYSQAY